MHNHSRKKEKKRDHYNASNEWTRNNKKNKNNNNKLYRLDYKDINVQVHFYGIWKQQQQAKRKGIVSYVKFLQPKNFMNERIGVGVMKRVSASIYTHTHEKR